MSLINTAYSALNAFQQSLNTIGNNIANVNTPGYSRQTAQLIPALTQYLGGQYIGNGVSLDSIDRNSDPFANFQVRQAFALKSQYDAYQQQAFQIDSMLSQSGVSLSSGMQTFFTALNQLNSTPDSITARDVFLKQTQTVVNQFNYMQNQLNQFQDNTTLQVQQTTQQVNALSTQIASINRQLLSTPNAPNLLDQRDQILNTLSQYVDVNVVPQSNGLINVTLSSGDALVSGLEANKLSATGPLDNNFGTTLLLNGNNVTTQVRSGQIKGLLDFEQNILNSTSQAIGLIAVGLTAAFNTVQNNGIDLNGQRGANLFGALSPRVDTTSTNTGNGVLVAQYANQGTSNLQLSDYKVSYDGSNYSVMRKSDGVTTNFATFPQTIDGMTLSLASGAVAAGDSFTLFPASGQAGNLNVSITDPNSIALATAATVSSASANTGDARLNLTLPVQVPNPANPITITFTSPTTVDISGTAPDNYSGVTLPITLSSGVLNLASGTAKVGDVFTIGPAGVGDNTNGLAMASLAQAKLFSSGSSSTGTQSLTEVYSNLTTTVGTNTSLAKSRLDSADVIYKQAQNFQSSISGVNLEEEATNLLQFQQAYQAAGKLMQISNQLMSVLFNMLG
jgi:flagellar hook-associated protein 1 FlgK